MYRHYYLLCAADQRKKAEEMQRSKNWHAPRRKESFLIKLMLYMYFLSYCSNELLKKKTVKTSPAYTKSPFVPPEKLTRIILRTERNCIIAALLGKEKRKLR